MMQFFWNGIGHRSYKFKESVRLYVVERLKNSLIVKIGDS
ncbi:hypothetical protein RU97_GL000679 [Enterococcus canis]|uniref:Uncharacterized protein n=1 Tax=Enterococcus canis TaxID=214095 RepID=A0A1L8RBH9_9ENTE|nr:hypothetical protein RU97_GL000679 [Enterococcus canis]